MRSHGQFNKGIDARRNDTGLRRAEPGRLGVRSLAARILTAVLLAAFAALLALPAQAQTTTLVTLVSNTHLNPSSFPSPLKGAQKFTTGTETGGYVISEVGIHVSNGGGVKTTTVTIRENNSNNRPGDLVDTLTNPLTFTNNNVNTFTAPPNLTLMANTDYWVSVNEGTHTNTNNQVSFDTARNDAQTGQAGWEIGNDRLWRNFEHSNWASTSDSLMIEVRSTVRTASTDATLSDLTLEGATGGETITLSPAFDDDTGTYTASVANRIDLVTLTATKNDDNAMVVITGDDDLNTPESAELDLVVGSNTLTVTVTAEDTTTTKTYTITVTQEKAPLVSNTEESLSGSGTNSLVAQSFETGASVGGFTISEVQLRLVSVTDKSTSVRIREDNSGEPATGDPVASSRTRLP